MGGINLLLTKSVELRKPTLEDGSNIWRLIRKTQVLDLNSAYYYLILSKYFKNTCIVAEHQGEIVGFVSAFLLPEKQNTLFIWQVAVDESQRGKGLASSLLQELLSREELSNVKYLETTISPSNKASQALFKKLAENFETEMKKIESISPEVFPNENHEPEQTYQIGPIH
ncbi:diaminobutyrate acetyltransferase [Aquibacillus albus]|uniref:L-2,4-diaminobutyric acid acetyltransferase n=1 Tax=Aquibacillus albus TaxID=1168171 RepID=A0ABS2MYA9_9BACI|nr:diaminobutyrate acetyltransferase [Aquibacillus albus]MBM7570879.1 L-2,4-diaminobutyric acid acetyltransferase [Aquibacillus albus]